ncbi:hypothetical protein HOD75_00085 [archaeon]|jgi:hypothetical protein|nr:hypothetical protein [Candidatus Woesearchaeota archaeon]MBT4136050.1 hypothetical protein [archaeon]MBT4241275.1 hypothetical protein [archaeon]MBT4418097.1 hypothetical protein [archaeon]
MKEKRQFTPEENEKYTKTLVHRVELATIALFLAGIGGCIINQAYNPSETNQKPQTPSIKPQNQEHYDKPLPDFYNNTLG